MPVFLKRNPERDCLYVSIGKMQKAEFNDTLARVKATPGRRPNPDGPDGRFVWEFPDNAETAFRLMTVLQPVSEPEIEQMVKDHAIEVAGQLITQVADDATDLKYPRAPDLFPYQRAAVARGAEQPRLLLADEMGLGKTIEAIGIVEEWLLRNPATPVVSSKCIHRAHYGAARCIDPKCAECRKHDRPEDLCVISPKAMRGTWAAEVEEWGIDRVARPIDGRTPKKRLEQLEDDEANVFILNWESFWRDPVLPALRAKSWAAIIADEAHRAKNRKAKQSVGLSKLDAPVKLALTGTPIMNSPDELWALLRWLYPDAYANFWAFHNSYVDEITVGYNRRVMVAVKNPDELRFELKDKLVRRRKTDVLKDLPEKLPPQIIEVELTPAQRRLYQEAEKALFIDAAEYVRAQAEKDVGFQEQGESTAGYEAEVKERAEQLAEELETMPMDRLKSLIPNAAARIAKLRQITAAAKIAIAEELIRDEPDTPVVAFTWHVQAARDLAEALSTGRPRMAVGTIAGNDDATPVMEAFQKGDLDHVVCTIAKGGTGLTLTRSSSPLMIEEDWTPAINDQAIDRVHRIGQTEPVTPRVLRCTGTVDDGRVAPRNAFKRAITAQVLGE